MHPGLLKHLGMMVIIGGVERPFDIDRPAQIGILKGGAGGKAKIGRFRRNHHLSDKDIAILIRGASILLGIDTDRIVPVVFYLTCPS